MTPAVRVLLALVAAAALWAVLSIQARAETYAEVAVLDRMLDGCLREPMADDWGCGYGYRYTLHVGVAPLPAWPWLEVYGEYISHNRNAHGEPAHHYPVAVGQGAGVQALLGPWRITLGGHSTHCTDRLCREPVAYNALTIRYTLGEH